MNKKMFKLNKLWLKYKRRLNNDIELENELGLRIRNGIHMVASTIGPYAKIILPNFRAVHYFYIIFMSFLGSILVYPVKNMRYVDALFLTGGASTQAGLNTTDINTLYLYQQIIVYIITTLTTPIFIHGSLLFARLYWFERHFDNIKERSKLNFKMRRSATLAGRRQSFDATRINTVNNQGLGFNQTNQTPSLKNEELTVHNTSPQSSSTIPKLVEKDHNNNSDIDHISEPSDSENEQGVPQDARMVKVSSDKEGPKFGNLPHPSNIRSKEIEPSDMYRSIAMLRDNFKSNSPKNNDDDDVLIIKSPNEIESDCQKPIFTKRSQIHFNVNKQPIKKWKQRKRKLTRGNQQWSKLKKSFSNTTTNSKKRVESLSQSTSDEEDDASIDSENAIDPLSADVNDDLNDEDDNDADDEEAMLDDEDGDEVNDNEDEGYLQDDYVLERAQSNLVIPSTDATGGEKFSKRSNTLDVTPGRKNSFIKSPTFEKMIKKKKRKSKRSTNRLFKIRTPSLYMQKSTASSGNSMNNDDEEGYNGDNDGHSLNKSNEVPTICSWVPTVGRNSTFVHLNEEQKEELGGVEYRAIKLLIKILIFYYVGFHILAFIFLLPWILKMPNYSNIVREQGVSPTWWAFFTAQSSFNDLGLTLTADSMQSFNRSIYVMVVMSFFIVIGNTGFPVFLRFIIWILFKFARPSSLFKESLGFLLDHPRRCFTLLFPSIPTWWLFSILVVMNVVDLVLFIILDLNNTYLEEIPVGYRIMDGLFQAFSTRTAGFTVVDLSQLHPAIQVSYMLMMYISVLPLAISIRRTNVYEEQSLGVYLKEDNNEHEDVEKTPKTFVGAHLRNQLSFDLWFIFLGLFIICIAEGSKLNKNHFRFSVFSILFEIISAYGTVGLSLGFPNVNASFSYELTTLSKLVIIAMMIRGRHRGLPYSLDRTIMLPDDDVERRDEVQEHHAIRRSTTMDTSGGTVNNSNDHNALRRAISRRASNFGFDTNIFRGRSSANNKVKTHFPNYKVIPENHEMNNLG
uniref:Potassium transport protein n=1 Tax=Schwanniomyces occidentalis TaxID=27300 RepID=Q9P851_SCHOC|nr:high-affinity potassium uptake transporter [Schwanniomyces occidentalis]